MNQELPWAGLIADVAHRLVETHPNEGCGLIVARGADYCFVQCTNQVPPPRAAHAYQLDPLEIARLEAQGQRVVAIAHSHTDGRTRFSAEDVRGALLFRPPNVPQPAYPGVDYLVVATDACGSLRAAVHRFDRRSPRCFREVWRMADAQSPEPI